jgi:hypothetical protein
MGGLRFAQAALIILRLFVPAGSLERFQ